MQGVGRWPDYLIERAGRRPPDGRCVVEGSTPVVSFGDPVHATVATLGINPSDREFVGDDGALLRGERRRLATLASLGVAGHEQINADRSAAIVDDCASYFDRRPYRRWFDPLDRLLWGGAGASYFDGSACHLDLVQWATTPVWGRLEESTRTRLLREDEPFLVRQLSREHYRLVIVNGRTVMRWAEAAGLVSWRCVGHLEGPPRVELYLGQGVGPTFVAWSCNIQSQPGATRHAPGLAGFIAEQVGSANEGGPGLTIDRLPKGTRLSSIDALVDRMRGWLEDSDTDTIGAVGTFGGKPWLIVDTPLGRMKLNADTRRDAVASFVAAADRSPLRMEVIASKSGKLNKVVFDGCQQQGWYAYLDRPRARPASVIVHAPAVTGEASIVQFNHPGGEHIPRQDVMPWNTGRTDRRKFLRTPGSAVNPEGEVTFRGELVCWGEWEPPSRIAYRWARHQWLPTVVHIPYWGDPPPGIRQNTDPWVFGPEFLYGNCKQRNPSGSPAALQNLMRGSLILFGSVRQGQFVIDTVFVVADAVGEYRPIDGVEYGSEAFQVCAIDSLASAPRPRETTYTLFRGATPDRPVNGMFSFVPCRPWVGDSSRFARPALRLDGVINPRSRQSASGAKHLRSAAEVYAAWRQVVRQVLVQDLQLGVGIADPPRHD